MEDITYKLELDSGEFEGPLALMLRLISTNKLEISEIRVSDIIDQYINYVKGMSAIDMELASEFVRMASHLVYVKTRMLLAGDEAVEEVEQLVSSLERVKQSEKYRAVMAHLPEMEELLEHGLGSFTKPPEIRGCSAPKMGKIFPEEIFAAMCAVLGRNTESLPEKETPPMIMPKRIIFGVREKCMDVIKKLRLSGGMRLSRLWHGMREKGEIIAAFLAVLELCAGGWISLNGDGDKTDIRLEHDGSEEELENITEHLE